MTTSLVLPLNCHPIPKARPTCKFGDEPFSGNCLTLQDPTNGACKDSENVEIEEVDLGKLKMEIEDVNSTACTAANEKPVSKIQLRIDANNMIIVSGECRQRIHNRKVYKRKYLRCRLCDKSFRFGQLQVGSLLQHMYKNHHTATLKKGVMRLENLNEAAFGYEYTSMCFDTKDIHRWAGKQKKGISQRS